MSSKKLGGDNPLRQKAVNLFYLIFLILLFSYVQSDFLDSTFHTNKTMEMMSNEYDQLNTQRSIQFLRMLKSDPDLFEDSRQSLMEIESISKNTIEYINHIKKTQIEEDKFNKYGYLKNGREESASNKHMIDREMGDSLFRKLYGFKQSMAKYLSQRDFEEVNKLLALDDYVSNSEGQLVEANNYYFKRTPLNISVLTLSQFAGRVERVKKIVLDKLMQNILEEKAAELPVDGFMFNETEDLADFMSTQSIKEFFEKLDPVKYSENRNEDKDSNQLTQFFIESMTDSVHIIGKPIKFNLSFDTARVKNISVNVKSEKGTEYFNVRTPSNFVYFPDKKGEYAFVFNNGIKTSTKALTVIDADPILENTRLSTLYIGIDNPLSIKTSEFDENDKLVAEINNGTIIRKGNIFYARVNSTGIVQIKIFVEKSYGKVKVAEKSFIVRELQPPVASLNTHKNGDIVSTSELSTLKDLKIKADEYLIDEQVYIADFNFLSISKSNNTVTSNIKNVGTQFNNEILKAISASKPGDILLFNNIRTLSSRGNEVVIPNLTITVN